MGTRRERVILEVEDRFTGPMAEAAAKTALLKRELNSLGGTSVRSARTELDQTAKSADKASKSIDGVGRSADASGKQIDRYSGRLRLFAEAAVAIGPAVVPISAAAIPAIAGLSAGLGALAGAAGVTALAFDGVGDALKAFNEYQLEPTAENLAEMQAAMEKIGPAGASLVRFLSSLEPELRNLQNVAREGLFPGIEAGISQLLPLLPQVQQIVGNIATELGRLMDDAGGALSGAGFAAFFDYLETDAATILGHFGRAIGNVAEGLADLTVAFGPLSLDFSSGLERMTRSFAEWAAGLSQTEGFQDFVDYVRESGPQVLDLLGSLGQALVAMAQAMAPWGSVVLPILTSLADILAAIASSPVGGPLFTAAAGFIALNRAVTPLRSGLANLSAAFLDLRTSPDRAATAMTRFGGAAKIAAGAAGMGLLIDGVHRTNEGLGALEGAAGGAMAGFAVGGPWGAAIGTAVGALGALATANDSTSGYVQALTGSLNAQTGALTANSRQIAAKALEDAGALEIADQLGLNLGTVTEAALGNEAAMAHLTAQMQAYSDVDTPAGVDIEMLKQREAGKKLLGTLHDLAGDTDSTVASQKRVAAAARRAGEAFEQQSAKMAAARSAARKTAQGFITLGDSLDDSKVSLREWLRQLEQQAAALRNFAQNARTAAKRGLDDGLIKSLQEAGPAGAMRMKQLANATDTELGRANRAWRAGQQAIRDYVNITVPPKKLKVDNDQAFSAINAVKYALAQLRDKTVTINTVHRTSYLNKLSGIPMPGQPSAFGNFNAGDVANRHQPTLSRMPQTRIWNEPETGGESYVPHANDDRRPRAKAILEATAGLFGGSVAWHATGGMYARAGAGGTPTSDLTFGAHAAANALGRVADSSERAADHAKKELEHRKRLLAKEVERDQKAVDLAREHRDAVREDIKSLRESIAERFKSDVFGQEGPQFDILPENFNDLSVEQQRSWLDTQYQLNQSMQQSPLDILRQDIAEAREARQLYRQLRAAGLNGAALTYAQQNASNGELAALLADPSMLRQYERLYGTRERVTQSAGQTAAMQRWGDELRRSNRELVEMKAELRESKEELRGMKRHLANMDKDGPERTGKAAGNAVAAKLDRVGANASRSR